MPASGQVVAWQKEDCMRPGRELRLGMMHAISPTLATLVRSRTVPAPAFGLCPASCSSPLPPTGVSCLHRVLLQAPYRLATCAGREKLCQRGRDDGRQSRRAAPFASRERTHTGMCRVPRWWVLHRPASGRCRWRCATTPPLRLSIPPQPLASGLCPSIPLLLAPPPTGVSCLHRVLLQAPHRLAPCVGREK